MLDRCTHSHTVTTHTHTQHTHTHTQIAQEASATAATTLTNSTRLNNSATDLAMEAASLQDSVNDLQQDVSTDQEAIAEATATANEAIVVANGVQARIEQLVMTVANLSRQLNATTFISRVRLDNVNATVTSLEQEADANEELISSVEDEIRQLQESAGELRARYVELQQHRDLLQEIFDNIEELDCRNQFQRG